jgi:predicted Zn finger-like uncharacterized protein
MIVQCPNCGTRYNFDEAGSQGQVRFRCTRCEHVFSHFIPDSGDVTDDAAPEGGPPDKNGDLDEQHSSDSREIPDDDHEKLQDPYDQPLVIDRRSSARIILLVVLLILTLVALVGFYLSGQGVKVPFFSRDRDQVEVREQTEFFEEDLKDIALENIRQYFVNNDNTGQLFVIEGQAVNNFSEPRSMIRIRVSLYDSHGSLLKEKVVLCGNTASLFQLQVSSREELESILESRMGVITGNKHVAPDGHTPFMAVFYDPPEEMQEFGIEVIEARNPVS